jgi:hypothetical protein
MALKFEGTKMNGPHIIQKFEINEDLIKSRCVQEAWTSKITYIYVKKRTKITQPQLHLISLQHRLNFHKTNFFGKSNNVKLGRTQDLA